MYLEVSATKFKVAMSGIAIVHVLLCLLVAANGRVTTTAAAIPEPGVKGNDKQYEDTPKSDSFVIELDQTDDGDIHTSDADNTTVCPTWFYPKTLMNGSTVCECGSNLGKTIGCNNRTHVVSLSQCYWITYSKDGHNLVAGATFYGCTTIWRQMLNTPCHLKNVLVPANPDNLSEVCGYYNRKGQLCGKCMKDFAPSVYSYSMSCVDCQGHASNWLKYVAVAFLPLTAFFVFVITFRISAASGLMNTLIFISQIGTAPVMMRLIQLKNPHISPFQLFALSSLYSMWNLDFFRSLYPPFCLHPAMTTVQALALDYAIAVYPLVLITISYLLVELHDHDFRIAVWLWKPFHKCFTCLRREWNIKLSLIDAFATFLLLSFVKFTNVSFDLLVPAPVFNIHGELVSVYLFYDGTMEYFGKEHLPYGILALVVLLVFNVFPLLLLCLYPCRCFQRCLNWCNLRSQLLRTFMDALQGYYKDGTNGTRDCRYFSALYLIVRMCFLIEGSVISFSNSWLPISVSLLLVVVFLHATFRPYKSPVHNNIDIFLLTIFTLLLVSVIGRLISSPINGQFTKLSQVMTGISFVILSAYSIGFLFYKTFARVRCVQNICRKIRAKMPCHCHEDVPQDFNQVFPYRMIHDEQYVQLSDEPCDELSSERNLITY